MEAKALFEHARTAKKEVATLELSKRIENVSNLKKLILNEHETIIDQIQKQTHKCRSDALMSEIYPVLDELHYFETHAKKFLSEKKVPTPIALMGKKSKIIKEPLGVVLIICPWNYPFFQAIVPSITSYVCGNATIYKPSEVTPLNGLVEDMYNRSGFENNHIQVAYGDGAFAESLIDQIPDKIFFIGSVDTGKKIMRKASSHLIPVELELGGKDPMIVFDDVNIDRAVKGATWGALTNSGQSCTSVENLYIHHSIYEEFKNGLLDEISRIKQEEDTDGNSDIGLMTTKEQCEVVASHLEEAKSRGASITAPYLWVEGTKKIPPILVENAPTNSKISTEETFGPVIHLSAFETEEEIIEKCNTSKFGLSASVWSKDLKRAERVAQALHTGNVSINNVMLTEANPHLPFGGVKQSGFGRYKGSQGFDTFSNTKSILIDRDSKKIEVNWYPYTQEKYVLFKKMMKGLFYGGFIGFIQFALNGIKLESLSSKMKRPKKQL